MKTEGDLWNEFGEWCASNQQRLSESGKFDYVMFYGMIDKWLQEHYIYIQVKTVVSRYRDTRWWISAVYKDIIKGEVYFIEVDDEPYGDQQQAIESLFFSCLNFLIQPNIDPKNRLRQ